MFNRDIRPILSQHCFACHGPDAHDRKGELRLDTLAGAVKGGESGKASIVPGKPDQSELWKRLITDDADDVMPPVDFHKDLDEKQKKALRQWILEGAEYQEHWAFITPKKPALPITGVKEYSNPIDKWVVTRLQKEKRQLSKKAAPHVLQRRLSFDLIGLPPKVGDPSKVKYDELPAEIDRLLASAHFGERMALPWLDASRYADTNGYSIDGGRHMWLWRDWVINAYNTNKPYDEFLREQLAGDLLPKPTESQLVATGYQRNNANTHEGGTIPKENLVNYVADRVKTLGESVMGVTTACSQCHDHKYDPLSQQEYYGLFAFFNAASDKSHDGNVGVNSHPSINALTSLSTPAEIAEVKREISEAQNKLEHVEQAELEEWQLSIIADEAERGKNFKLIDLKHLTATMPNGSISDLQIDKKGESLTIKRGYETGINVCCEIPKGTAPVTGMRVTFYPDNKGMIGFGKNGTMVLTTVSPCFSSLPSMNIDHNSLIQSVRLTSSSHRPGFETHYLKDTRVKNGWSPADNTKEQHLTFTFPQAIDTSTMNHLTTELVFNAGGRQSSARFEIQLFTGNDPDSEHSVELIKIVKTPTNRRSPEQVKQLKEFFKKHSPHKLRQRIRLANLNERLGVLTKKHPTMVMDTAKKPRVTHFLERGDYAAPRHEVKPGTPAFLPPLKPAKEAANRLDLARWLTRPDHPLTARVAVNNIWSIFFGQGLVSSRADFGSQGSYPSHPELLDWLAVHFQESGWDVKALVRLIVSSETYQQQSSPTVELLLNDPQNKLLARGPRFRLSAEHIRDQALAHSGLLVTRIGGPSVKTYHPGDLWRQVSHYGSSRATAQSYHRDNGEKLYRRSMYTYWKRTLPPPSLTVFDAPNREVCLVGRGVTNTPLQAFILLNSPQYIEASRVLAAKILQANHPNDLAGIGAAFTQVTGRKPQQHELELLEKALQKELARYKGDDDAAQKLLLIGDAPPSGLPAPRHAAWTNLCQLLLNLSETVTRY